MSTCTLCKSRTADKTGSHLVPHFLLKRVDSENKGRDKEIGFVLDEQTNTSYFGRSVLPEDLDDIYGELTDNDIANNKNPFIEDYIFCSLCESRFANIESVYSNSLKYSKEENYINNQSSGVAFLFWTSIIWRLSLDKNSGFRLTDSEEEKLRSILDSSLSLKTEQLPKSIKPEWNELSYHLLRSPNYPDKARLIFCQPHFRRPYSIIIDEYVLFYYFKKGHIKSTVQSFYGLENLIKNEPTNTYDNGESIIYVDSSTFKQVNSEVFQLVTKHRFKYYDIFFNQIHQKCTGRNEPMPSDLKQQIISKIVESKEKMGRSYTKDHLFNTIIDVLTNQNTA